LVLGTWNTVIRFSDILKTNKVLIVTDLLNFVWRIAIIIIIIIIIIPKQHSGKARIQGTGEDRYMWHCTDIFGKVVM